MHGWWGGGAQKTLQCRTEGHIGPSSVASCRDTSGCTLSPGFSDGVPCSGGFYSPFLEFNSKNLYLYNGCGWPAQSQCCSGRWLTEARFTALSNFFGVNVLIVVGFQLPLWCHWSGCWEEMCTITLCELAQAQHCLESTNRQGLAFKKASVIRQDILSLINFKCSQK